MISDQEFYQLLQKHKAGQCTEAELQLIDEHLAGGYQAEDAEGPSRQLIDQTFEHIISNINVHEQRTLQRRRTIKLTVLIAATLLLFSSAAITLYQNKNIVYNYLHPVAYTQVAAPKGKNMIVNLPDGSVVTLNQESKLIYSDRFNGQLREVSLSGEAYFQVTKNKAKPFIVHTGKLSTKVLGTSFNVQAYPFSGKITVALITGKVWLHSDQPKGKGVNYVLTPDQAVSYDVKNGSAQKEDVNNAENYIAWKDGKIRFSNTTMEEAVQRLNVTFKSHIGISGPGLAHQRIYGEFGINESPANIVSDLCVLIKAKYKIRQNGEIIIYAPINKEQIF